MHDPRAPLLLRLFPRAIIRSEDGDPYLIRYTLLWTPWFRLYAHHILRSDEDRDMHCHPWAFVSLVLAGGYREHRPVLRIDGKDVRCSCITTNNDDETYGCPRRPLSIAFRRAEDMHRVELFQKDSREIPAWTLVACGRKKREWGFMTPDGWVPWHQYLNATAQLDHDSTKDE
jgi:hypothetical protein